MKPDTTYREAEGNGLGTRHLSTLQSAMARILPSGPDGPGAAEAGAAGYAERAFREVFDDSKRRRLVVGLDLLEGVARDSFSHSFASCSAAQQDEVLALVGEIPHPTPRRFLRLLIALTLQGFLCDPKHGGNRAAWGWAYLGFEPRSSGGPVEPS